MTIANNSQSSVKNLMNLAKNQTAIISEIIDNKHFGVVDTMVSRRLQDLGFLAGTKIKVIAKMPIGSPIVIQLANGVQFSLRKEEAQKIQCIPH